MENQNTGNKKLILTLASVVALGTIGYMVYSGYNKPQFNVEVKETQNSKEVETTTQNTNDTTKENNKYKNGTYTKMGDYVSPGGPEQIEVTVTVIDGVITDATVVAKATLAGSVKMQNAFIGGFKEFVIGKNIEEIKLDKVAGSSLTPKGFNEAIQEVMQEAKI